MVVDYSQFMRDARDAHIPQKTILVQLPPSKADCTCVGDVPPLMNSPHDYCSNCGNRGYIETKVEHSMLGAVVDYMSDTQIYPGQLRIDEGGDFDVQRYVIHANESDCSTGLYPGQNCFDLAKEVTIEGQNYRILSIDKSTLLAQIKVMIARKQ